MPGQIILFDKIFRAHVDAVSHPQE